MKSSFGSIGVRRATGVVLGAVLLAACGTAVSVDEPPVNGRRVQGATVVAGGDVPYRLSAYELAFDGPAGNPGRARRAALLADLVAGQGAVRGFVEYGRPGEAPALYVATGWGRQRTAGDASQTVFEITLNHLETRGAVRAAPEARPVAPIAVRVVVDERSGDATLTSRR